MQDSLTFADLGLTPKLLENVARAGYETATPVQAQAIPPILDGRDLLGGAPTGTGKTAAFTLPMLQRLGGKSAAIKPGVRGLVLSPTRELAQQIADSLIDYGRGTGLKHVVIYGGVKQGKQVRGLQGGAQIVVATPGRLIDLMDQGHVDLSKVEMLVLDEADRMLDMGFIPAVRRIAAACPPVGRRQTLLFSATVPPTIAKLVAELMRDPARVDIAPETDKADLIEQKVMFVRKADKPDLLAHVIHAHGVDSAIVFSRTKHGADRIVKQLGRRSPPIKAAAIHGNRNQNQRQKALDAFKSGKVPVLVATDVAARGIDVDDVSHVIQYDLTHEPETYVHRIGRTGRAGADGVALSFCAEDERQYLRDIQRLLKREIPVDRDHPHDEPNVSVPLRAPTPQTKPGGKSKPAGRRGKGGKPKSGKPGSGPPQTRPSGQANAKPGKKPSRRRRKAAAAG